MRRYFLRPPRPMPQVVVAFFLAACAAPDVSGEIGAFSSAEKAVHEPLKKVLDADLAATRQARINRVIEVGDSVYLPSAMCQAIAGGEAIGQPCVPEDAFVMDEDMARIVLAEQLLASLENYLDAISLLAGSKAPGDIATAVPVLTADIKTLTAAVKKPDLANVGATLDRFSSALSIVAGMATEAARASSLRRAVRKGDDAVGDAVASLIAVLEYTGATKVQVLAEQALAADTAMEEARNSGDTARYRAAVTRFEQAAAAASKESQTSLAGQLMAVRTTHAALAKRLAAGASIADILEFTNQLAQLRAAIDAAKG